MVDRNREADRLFSKVVRQRGYCQSCGGGSGPFECAHIIRRRYLRTRWFLDNAWCLHPDCHREVDTNDRVFSSLVEGTIGWPRYDELRAIAHATDTPIPDRAEVRAWLRLFLKEAA